MAFEIFTADTIAGKFLVAVRTHKAAMPGDNRSDAYKVVEARWGRGARLTQSTITARRLSDKFIEDSTAPGWGYIARADRADGQLHVR